MATAISAGGRKNAEINMTPLIDVLLVLIIIFMVIIPLTPRGATSACCSAALKRSLRREVVPGDRGDGAQRWNAAA